MKLVDVKAYCRARVNELSQAFKEIPRDDSTESLSQRIENLAKRCAYQDVIVKIESEVPKA